MKKKAIIFDLDNTIYPVESIGNNLFKQLFEAIETHGGYDGNIEEIKKEIMRRPFQVVAKDFKFHDELLSNGLKLLSELTYDGDINSFEDYHHTKDINCQKFLVTTGFTKLQLSKIDKLGLKTDFKEFFIVDPSISDMTKKDIFKQIMQKYDLTAEEVLVVGDDINSEIKAAKELGIDTVIYDFQQNLELSPAEPVIIHYSDLAKYI